MLKRICDRCGAEALDCPTGLIGHCGDNAVDLCERCDKQLNKWAHDPETIVVTPLEEDAMFGSIPDLCVNDISKINNVGKTTAKSSLPKYFTVSREEYGVLLEERSTLRKIVDIAYCDDMDHYEKMERILDIL